MPWPPTTGPLLLTCTLTLLDPGTSGCGTLAGPRHAAAETWHSPSTPAQPQACPPVTRTACVIDCHYCYYCTALSSYSVLSWASLQCYCVITVIIALHWAPSQCWAEPVYSVIVITAIIALRRAPSQCWAEPVYGVIVITGLRVGGQSNSITYYIWLFK